MKIILIPAVFLLFTSCKKAAPEALPWYSAWISKEQGKTFHSEILLAPSDTQTIKISSSESLVVGFIAQKGYEISQSGSFIFLGTEASPRTQGASLGAERSFESNDGVIIIKLENISTIATQVALYTSPSN